jgi:hypothetical protein
MLITVDYYCLLVIFAESWVQILGSLKGAVRCQGVGIKAAPIEIPIRSKFTGLGVGSLPATQEMMLQPNVKFRQPSHSTLTPSSLSRHSPIDTPDTPASCDYLLLARNCEGFLASLISWHKSEPWSRSHPSTDSWTVWNFTKSIALRLRSQSSTTLDL